MVRGIVDSFDWQGAIGGWALVDGSRAAQVPLQVLCNGSQIAAGTTSRYRPDLTWAPGNLAGFNIALDRLVDPATLADGTMQVIADGVALPTLSGFAHMGTGKVHWCRKVMNDATRDLVGRFETARLDALEISGDRWRKLFKWKSYLQQDYPDFDINFDVVVDKKFDFIFAEQVLEHVRYPYRAVRNVHRMLKPGGRFLVTTPFLIHMHAVPSDYTRWTEDGLKYLMEECGFETSRCITGSWGNIDCVISDLKDCYDKAGWNWYEPSKHSLENHPRFPTAVWALAQKDE